MFWLWKKALLATLLINIKFFLIIKAVYLKKLNNNFEEGPVLIIHLFR